VVLIIYPGDDGLVTDPRGWYWDGEQWRQADPTEHNKEGNETR
jgi:hypothetical protein